MLNSGIIKVVDDGLSINARRSKLKSTLAKERSIFTCSEVAFSELNLISSAVESVELGSLKNGLKSAWVLVALSEGIINIDVLHGLIEFGEEVIADC